MIREEITKKSLDLALANKITALEFATGVGKSKIALDIINHLKQPSFKALIVIAELAHLDNWEKEKIKWKYDKLTPNIEYVTYASLKKHRSYSYDLIILDEAHHIGSDIRLDIITEIKFNKLLLLSATLGNELKLNLTQLLKTPIVSFKISLQEAIDWKLLPVPNIYIIPLTLDPLNTKETIVETWGKANSRKHFKCSYKDRWTYLKNKKQYPNVHLEISCTEQQKYNYLDNKFNYYKSLFFKTRNERTKNAWLQIGSLRKRFLGELKTSYTKKLISQLQNKRFICFCSSINQADILGGEDHSIHSKKDNSAEIIENFNSKKINQLYAVGMLKEGQNLTDIDVGIIVQLDGIERAFIQKFGRSLRAENPIQYILYFKNTKDEEYLKNILEGIDVPTYTKTINL